MRRPRSRMRLSAAGPQTPLVSTATGANAYDRAKSRYSEVFRDSEDAAAPAKYDVCGKCEGAKVSGQVLCCFGLLYCLHSYARLLS